MRPIAFLFMLVPLVACDGSAAPQGPTAATVAAQQGDVPAGMARCDLSGDIASFLNQEKDSDPATYQSTKSQWDDARSKNATAAYVAVFADSKAHCDSIKTSGADLGAATYKVVINFVVQFKDQPSAAKAYTSETIFNISAGDLKNRSDAVEGEKTGLSSNSIVLDTLVASQSYYIAVWQNKQFLVILAVLNTDSASAKKVATAENSRIK
ncbi:MAG TPA: hypothetical protein VJR46_03500 [Candidatus Dormibacteraeota bacterium]|nr:hypothetical protein [Candidatus Dormibacteraeota bacterium]